jgi:hypothetical protein
MQNKQFHCSKIKRFLPLTLTDIYLTRLSMNYSVMQEFIRYGVQIGDTSV